MDATTSRHPAILGILVKDQQFPHFLAILHNRAHFVSFPSRHFQSHPGASSADVLGYPGQM
eukprot:2431138-Amphidinium_carterae.1